MVKHDTSKPLPACACQVAFHLHRSNDLYVILLLTVDQDLSGHVPPIHSMFRWQEVFGC